MFVYLSIIQEDDDKDKFKLLYEKYKTMMYGICYSILKSEMDAEDAVHDAFLKLSKYIFKISDIFCSKTQSFLVILSRSSAIDIYRKKKQHYEKIDDIDIENSNVGITQDILEDIISDEGYKKLVGVLDKMESTYKDTLKLKFIYGYTDAEISELQNISLNTVKMRIYRGKNLLKEKLVKEVAINYGDK